MHCKWTSLDLDRELRRDWVLDRDLGVKYGRGQRRLIRLTKNQKIG